MKKLSVVFAVFLLVSCRRACREGGKPGETVVFVIEVIDGDTIRASSGERVRYIGIDTPETVHPDKEPEPFGKEASNFNRELVEGKQIRLVFGKQRTDRYGRKLAYIFLVDGTFVQAELVKAGLARVSSFSPNLRYQIKLLKLQREAKFEGRGLWRK